MGGIEGKLDDVAIFDDSQKRTLLAKKPLETEYRFVGGFIGPNETAEDAAVRETREETHLEIGGIQGLKYVGSCIINDWRYRSESENILTFLYSATKVFGIPEADDDIEELKWFDLTELAENDKYKNILVKEHIPLYEMILNKYSK